MPTLQIQGQTLEYDESSIINFDEGLIGLPHLRHMALVEQAEIKPFMWLVSLDDERMAFLVVDPRAIFKNYKIALPREARAQIELLEDEKPLVLAVAVIASEWTRSTVNLRAPLVIAPRRMRGMQFVLTDSSYCVAEPLLLAQAA